MQTIVVSLKSQWDWFVTKSGGFVIFAQNRESKHSLSPKKISELQSIGQNKPIERQIEILSQTTGIDSTFPQSTKEAIQELTLVRNLGIHDRWEVDEIYLNRSTNAANWGLGEFRTVSVDEVELWERCTLTIVRNVAFPLAFRYGSAPSYPE